MELNTINKTGTWSETADRINSNFSKISIEVEEIKQNGCCAFCWRLFFFYLNVKYCTIQENIL